MTEKHSAIETSRCVNHLHLKKHQDSFRLHTQLCQEVCVQTYIDKDVHTQNVLAYTSSCVCACISTIQHASFAVVETDCMPCNLCVISRHFSATISPTTEDHSLSSRYPVTRNQSQRHFKSFLSCIPFD